MATRSRTCSWMERPRQSLFSGTTPIQANTFSPVKIWDTSTPISNTNSLALGNIFIGSFDHNYTDPNASNGSYPFQNLYIVSIGGGTVSSPFNFSYLNFASAPAWGAAHNSGTVGWNYTAGGAETDYFQNVYVGAPFAHAFYAANSTNTGWNLLGGFSPAGDIRNANGIVVPASATGNVGGGAKVVLYGAVAGAGAGLTTGPTHLDSGARGYVR